MRVASRVGAGAEEVMSVGGGVPLGVRLLVPTGFAEVLAGGPDFGSDETIRSFGSPAESTGFGASGGGGLFDFVLG